MRGLRPNVVVWLIGFLLIGMILVRQSLGQVSYSLYLSNSPGAPLTFNAAGSYAHSYNLGPSTINVSAGAQVARDWLLQTKVNASTTGSYGGVSAIASIWIDRTGYLQPIDGVLPSYVVFEGEVDVYVNLHDENSVFNGSLGVAGQLLEHQYVGDVSFYEPGSYHRTKRYRVEVPVNSNGSFAANVSFFGHADEAGATTINPWNTFEITGIKLPDGTTPEARGYQMSFSDEARTPNKPTFGKLYSIPASQDTIITQHPDIPPYDGNGNYDSLQHLLTITKTGNFTTHSLLKFDMSAYAGKLIDGDVTLALFVNGQAAFPNSVRSISVRAITTEWDSESVTWNNFGGDPGVDLGIETGSVLDTTDIQYPVGGNRYETWTLPQSLVQSWIDAPESNHGLLIANEVLFLNSDIAFESLEGPLGNVPLLAFSFLPTAGDHNLDGIVDAADYVAWKKIGSAPDGYDDWRQDYGERTYVVSTVVPEPLSSVSVVVGFAILAVYVRKRF